MFRSFGRLPAFRFGLAAIFVGGLLAGCGSTPGTPVTGTQTPLASAGVSTTTSAGSTSGPTLRDLAGSRYFGSAIDLPQLDTDANYAAIAGTQFSQITPENVMKWQLVEPTRGQYTWSRADEIVAFAQAHDMKIRGHVLVWHSQMPDWLTGGTWTKATLSEVLKEHITTEMGRYAGKIYAWDVVNEAVLDDGTRRPNIWQTTIGDEYIADAFNWAHAADPAAKLYINDYDTEAANTKSDALYNLVKTLKSQGVPIDGVGFQGHFDLKYPFPAGFADNMKRFTDLGVEVAITETDVRVNTPSTADELSRQADYYRQTVAACLAVPRCVGITLWEFTDKYSWVPGFFPGEGDADLYDASLQAKPALTAVQQALAGK